MDEIQKIIKDRYFWYITILIAIISIVSSFVDMRLSAYPNIENSWHPIFMAIQNFLFLAVVIISTRRFGFKGGLATGLVIGLIQLPHAVTMINAKGQSAIDSLTEYGVFAPVGVIISWVIAVEKRANDKNRRYSAIVESSDDAIISKTLDGIITSWNKGSEKIYGYKEAEVIGQPISILIPPERHNELPMFLEKIRQGEHIVHYETIRQRKDQHQIFVSLSISPILDERGKIVGASTIARDISERQKLQEQLMAQDRLVSIGQLVSGVAHELNNPLTSVIGFSDLLLQKDLPDDVKGDLAIVNNEAKRTADIVKNLLTFARQQPQTKQLVDVTTCINSVLKLRKHEQDTSNITVDTRFPPGLSKVMGNSSQLQQVCFNIVVNAEQAMIEAHHKGHLTILAEQVGDNIKVTFADDGPGISSENMGKLFTPFFTTKEVGKGTGLGLSISHGIISEHGGKIYAESELGKGTSFIVGLPVFKINH